MKERSSHEIRTFLFITETFASSYSWSSEITMKVVPALITARGNVERNEASRLGAQINQPCRKLLIMRMQSCGSGKKTRRSRRFIKSLDAKVSLGQKLCVSVHFGDNRWHSALWRFIRDLARNSFSALDNFQRQQSIARNLFSGGCYFVCTRQTAWPSPRIVSKRCTLSIIAGLFIIQIGCVLSAVTLKSRGIILKW